MKPRRTLCKFERILKELDGALHLGVAAARHLDPALEGKAAVMEKVNGFLFR